MTNITTQTNKNKTKSMKYTDETFYDAVRGDEEALKRVIVQFTPLVHKFVHKYKFMAAESMYQDLVQEGLLGIWKAVKTFDLERKYNGRKLKPITWIYPLVRSAVQGAARKEKKNPKYALSLEQSDWGSNLEDPTVYEVPDNLKYPGEKELLMAGCRGNLEGTRAQIVMDRFGLMGRKPMRQMDVAAKYNMSKQSLNGHLTRFYSTVRSKMPNLTREIL